MKSVSFAVAALLAAGGASAASAQSTTATSGPFPVTGNVPILCTAGTLSNPDGVFAVGVLVDLTTGLLRTDLAAPPKILQGTFCSSRSTITISATPMIAQNFAAVAPEGFSKTVNFTATAAGWTPAPASFTTGAATNPNAVQVRNTCFTGDITVSIGSFTTGGGNSLRLGEDPLYQGSVVVTLAAAS